MDLTYATTKKSLSGKSRIPCSRSHSTPRKYISRVQLDRQIRNTALEVFQECIKSPESSDNFRTDTKMQYGSDKKEVCARKNNDRILSGDQQVSIFKDNRRTRSEDRSYKTRHISDSIKVLFQANKEISQSVIEINCDKPTEKPKDESISKKYQEKETKPLKKTIVAVDPKMAKKLVSPQKPIPRSSRRTEDELVISIIKTIFNFIKAVLMIPITIASLELLQAIDGFFIRLSKSSLVALVIIVVLFVVWAYEFGEPADRIREAVGDLFKDRSSSWWNI